jgi:hypothetical protein
MEHIKLLLWAGIAQSIETGYGLEGRWIDSRWGRVFSQPSIPAVGLTHPPIQYVYNMYRVSLDHPPLSSAEIKERVEL